MVIKAVLEIGCHPLVEHGANPKQFGPGRDAFSDAIIAGYSARVSSDDPAVLVYEIG